MSMPNKIVRNTTTEFGRYTFTHHEYKKLQPYHFGKQYHARTTAAVLAPLFTFPSNISVTIVTELFLTIAVNADLTTETAPSDASRS